MAGWSLVKGMGVTLKKFFEKKITTFYPEEKPILSPRFRGSFTLYSEKCISCNLCADACPNKVIKINSSKNEQGKKVLEDYSMNLSYCLFCGLCTEACPTQALVLNGDFELSCFHKQDTIYELYNKESVRD